MPRHRLTLILWLAGLLGLQANAAGQCSKPLKVGLSDLGYGAYQAQGQTLGLLPDVLRELGRRSGCELQINFRPRARALQEFMYGELDVLTSALQTRERDEVGVFMPYGYTELDLVLSGEDLARSIDSFAALERRPELRLGLVRGITMGAALDARMAVLLANKQAEYSTDFHNLAAKLKAGRVQAAIMPFAIHAKMLADGELAPGTVIIDLPENLPQVMGLYLNRNSTSAADRLLLRKHLSEMLNDGWMQRQFARYFGEAKIKRVFSRGAPLLP